MKMAPIDKEKANEYIDWFYAGFNDKMVDLYNEKLSVACSITNIELYDSITNSHSFFMLNGET